MTCCHALPCLAFGPLLQGLLLSSCEAFSWFSYGWSACVSVNADGNDACVVVLLLSCMRQVHSCAAAALVYVRYQLCVVRRGLCIVAACLQYRIALSCLLLL